MSKGLDQLWEDLDQRTRRAIRKADKIGLKIEEDLSLEEFYRVNSLTFQRQGIPTPYDLFF